MITFLSTYKQPRLSVSVAIHVTMVNGLATSPVLLKQSEFVQEFIPRENELMGILSGWSVTRTYPLTYR